MITPKEIIKYNKEFVLGDSAMFRGAGIADLRRFKCNPFTVLYWYIKTHLTDIKTRRFYNSINTDPNHWIIFEDDNMPMKEQQKYIDWMDENDIKYHTFWYDSFFKFSIFFENKEDAMAFKLKWL